MAHTFPWIYSWMEKELFSEQKKISTINVLEQKLGGWTSVLSNIKIMNEIFVQYLH